MNGERLFQRAKDTVSEMVWGSETRGKVFAIRTDRNIPDFTHVLIKTDTGEMKKFVIETRDLYYDGLQVLRVGNDFAIRSHKPALLTPIGPECPRLEEDPFFLEI